MVRRNVLRGAKFISILRKNALGWMVGVVQEFLIVFDNNKFHFELIGHAILTRKIRFCLSY